MVERISKKYRPPLKLVIELYVVHGTLEKIKNLSL